MAPRRYCQDCGAECCDRCGECLGEGCVCDDFDADELGLDPEEEYDA